MKKPFQIAAYVLALAIQASLCSAECVLVEPTRFESGPVVQLAVMDKDKPMAGAKIQFYLFDSGSRLEKATVTLVSDEFGRIESPKLSDGQYEIIATTEHNLRADLHLEVPSNYSKRTFKMELLPGDPQHENPEAATLEKVPVASHVQLFRGNVTDPSGAAIPGTTIRIFRRGAQPTKVVETLRTGSAGEFETKLEVGSYVSRFSAQGFAVKLVGFEIVSGDSGPLTVMLNIGSC